jgi:hypothetical protein
MILKNKKELIAALKKAADDDTLMTPKHDPNKMAYKTYSTYRTVLSYELAEELKSFIAAEDYDVIEYENCNPNYALQLFEIISTNPTFSVPASGVGPDNSKPSTALDRLIAVCGNIQGWHMYGDSSKDILSKCKKGKLKKKKKLE